MTGILHSSRRLHISLYKLNYFLSSCNSSFKQDTTLRCSQYCFIIIIIIIKIMMIVIRLSFIVITEKNSAQERIETSHRRFKSNIYHRKTSKKKKANKSSVPTKHISSQKRKCQLESCFCAYSCCTLAWMGAAWWRAFLKFSPRLWTTFNTKRNMQMGQDGSYRLGTHIAGPHGEKTPNPTHTAARCVQWEQKHKMITACKWEFCAYVKQRSSLFCLA